MRYYLGIDNGGTNTKAAIFSFEGKQVAVETLSTAAITDAPRLAERDMENMWHDNCTVIRNLLKKSRIVPKEIVGIGVCGHGKGLYLWGKDEKPVRNGILSSDTRALEYVKKWREDGTEQKQFPLTCQHIMACQPTSLLAWLRDNEPITLERTKWIFPCKDYIRFRLTGVANMELTDCSGSGLLNLNSRNYDTAILKIFGLEQFEHILPPLCASLDICAGISREASEQTGLCEGTPVIGGMFDIDACCLATGVENEKDICMIAGTWSINEYLRKEPVMDGSVLMNSLFCFPEYYLIEESSATSAGNNEWFVCQLLPELKKEAERTHQSVYSILNAWVSEFSPEEICPVFLPFLAAGNADLQARGAFIGLTAAHTRKHMARAVYEGIVFSHRWHFDRLMLSRKAPNGHIRLAGGAANSAIWAQMFADVMGVPVDTVPCVETGALGCCIAVAVAIGDYKDMQTALERMCAKHEAFIPDRAAHEAYERKYQMYLKAIECLRPLWPEMRE